LGESAEVGDDSWHGSADDCLVQRAQEHSQQDTGQCDDYLSSGQGANAHPLNCYIIIVFLLICHVFIYITDVGESIAECFGTPKIALSLIIL
jgi:hypothetical protein